ncbi:uncharacterized protein LOC124370167 [Homalodisca vitripennis]|uniref:uncharacterized protein LOC124370167 n=1 Tax=Homalodisca vitripennis TaxID=197043 RepID=UPI001EEB6EBC|nr:uncharacterized protein LOC124370167 [Homalodisca vitripennis]
MANCAKCLKPISKTGKNSVKVDCVECKKPFHGKCVDMTPEDIKYYEDNQSIWRCSPCSKERRKSMAIESRSGSSITYDDIYSLVTDLRKDLKGIKTNLGKSINTAFEEIKETKSLVSKQNEEMAALLELVNKLTAENSELKNRVSMLESRIEDSEQYSRRDTIEIHGVPVEKVEQVLEVVKSVGKALDLTIENSMVSACHRLRSRDGTDKPPGIIVKMTRRIDAESLLQRRRVKRNFSTHHIGLTASPAQPIYINESLCPGRRRLLNAARVVKGEKQYTYLWIRGGKILMRKAEKAPVKVITSQADLAKL